MKIVKPIYFFIGTEAELIKIFPVIMECQERGILCHIIASGQNDLKKSRILEYINLNGSILELSQECDIVKSAAGLLNWFWRTKRKAANLIKNQFGETNLREAYLIVHGDTVSTMMGAMLGKKFGMQICHVEAGLRSHNLLNPFPEEIDRLITSKMARLHFAPGDTSVQNLKNVKGKVINTQQNTLLDSLRFSEAIPVKSNIGEILNQTYFVFVMHRQENLANRAFVCDVTKEIIEAAKKYKCVIILHEITKNAFVKFGLMDNLRSNSNIILQPRVDYFDFMKLLQNASFVITDGGSNQEELFYMNKPCLIMRKTTERYEGIGKNARLFNGKASDIRTFVDSVGMHKYGGGGAEGTSFQYYRRYADKRSSHAKIRILALSWRDIRSPGAGGAEVNTHAMFKSLDSNLYSITHISPLYENLQERECIDDIMYIRHGNIYTVIPFAIRYYKKHRADFDFVIDQCNTHRFFTPFWVKKCKRIFLIYQLTRDIWDINMTFPFNKIGKMLENTLLRLNKNDITITESESTKNDLINVGFHGDKVFIIPIIMKIDPWDPKCFLDKSVIPQYVYVGRYAKYKGIDFAVEALGLLKREYVKVQLIIFGKKDKEYIQNRLLPICEKYQLVFFEPKEYDADQRDKEYGDADIIFAGYVSEEEKLKSLSRAKALVFPSNREGWGIPISEAAYVGTPSIVFNSAGLIDAVDNGKAGYVCREKSALGVYEQMKLTLEDSDLYMHIRESSYEFTRRYLEVDVNKMMTNILI